MSATTIWSRSNPAAWSSRPTGTRSVHRRPTSATPGQPGSRLPAAWNPTWRRVYVEPPGLKLNQWAPLGDWTVGEQVTTLNEPGGRIAFRFHARDLNLVLGSQFDGGPLRFSVLIDGEPPNGARGIDVDERGNGAVADARLYQLIRGGPITDRSFEITFLDPGAQAYVFTFG